MAKEHEKVTTRISIISPPSAWSPASLLPSAAIKGRRRLAVAVLEIKVDIKSASTVAEMIISMGSS